MSVLDRFDLTGKRALVTGGNRGLGTAFATALAEAGAAVAIAGRDAERNTATAAELAGRGFTVHTIATDLTEETAADRMTGRAVELLGGLDILVNNAGTRIHKESWQVTDEEWDEVFDLNVRALWKCSVAAARHMAPQQDGAIVNIGSMSGMVVNRPQWQPAYNASKAAVHQLTKSLAAEWAPVGIRVNAVAPGYVKTEMSPVDRPELRRYWIEDAPQQRYAMPEEIAPSVVFLAGAASSFMTGSVLVVDGGYTVF